VTVYNARDVLAMSIDDIASLPTKEITILFEDNITIKTTIRKTVYSKFFWRIHETYDKLPIYSRHFVDHILSKNDGALNSDTHISLLSIIAKDTIELYQLDDPVLKERLYALIYQITNTIYNDLGKYIETSVVSIDILDFLNIAFDPRTIEANQSLKPTPKNIEKMHKKVLNIINTGINENNNIVKAIKAKMVNANQVTQCLSLRGYLSEVDGKVLAIPITSNFTLGLNKLHDFVLESRSAAKSLYFSEAPLEDAEYFARRLQLLCMYVERLVPGDCGSTDYVKWQVRGPTFTDTGELEYQGDLNFMKGKWYLDPVSNTFKAIEGNEKHLENQTILLRSTLSCKLPNKHEVCHRCFGKLASNINAYTNLGHICAATMTRQTSQSVLSIKHYLSSSLVASLSLNNTLAKYFSVNKAKTSLIMLDHLKKLEPKLTIAKDDALGLIDILSSDIVEDINPVYISSIDTIGLSLKINNNNIIEELDMVQSNRKCMLSKPFITYVKDQSWTLDNNGNFVFDLKDWDYSQEILTYPKKEYSYSDHSKQVAKIIETGISELIDRGNPESIVYTLKELFDLVNHKLNVNLSLLEVIIYAMSIPYTEDPNSTNSDLPRHYPEKCLGKYGQVIGGRSLSTIFAYQNQSKAILSPEAFSYENRPDSVYDTFLLPNQVLTT
jgi:hypothetical protein